MQDLYQTPSFNFSLEFVQKFRAKKKPNYTKYLFNDAVIQHYQKK